MSTSTVRTQFPQLTLSSSQILAAGLLVSLGVRLLWLGSKSLWLDEANTLRVASQGQEAIWSQVVEVYHPPLFYLFVAYWMKGGQGEWWLRLPSVILGCAGVLLLYWLARELFAEAIALSALWLAALSPLLVWYAQELRSYMLVLVLGLAAVFATVRFLQSARIGWWLAFTVTMVGALYTHYNAFLLVPVQLLLAAALLARGRSRPRRLLLWLGAWPPIALAYWPWLRTPAPSAFWHTLTAGNSYVAMIVQDRLGVLYPEQEGWLLIAGAALGTPLLMLLVYWLFRWKKALWPGLREDRSLQLLLGIGFLLLLGGSVYPRGYSMKRQLTIVWPFVLLLFAWFWPWRAQYRSHLAIALGASLVATLVNVAAIPKDQWRETAAYIVAQAEAGDVVLLLPNYMTIPFNHYTQGTVQGTGIRPDVPEVAAAVAGHRRVWLITHRKDVPDPDGVVVAWLAEHATPVTERSFYNIQVRLYQNLK